jgi:kynurenine formamidase
VQTAALTQLPWTGPDGGLGAVQVIDLSQPITGAMARWRGTDRAEVTMEEVPIEHAVPGARISATRLSMVTHAGTHVDAARHFFPHGHSIDEYELARFVCRGVALDVRRDGPRELTADELRAADPGIRAGDAVLLYFGYAERYTDHAYHDHPYLSGDAAEYLAEREIGILGVDLLTPDRPAGRRETPFAYPVHGTLLARDILIVENLGPGLARVTGREFLFIMPPFTIPGADASPVVPLALVAHPT